MASIYKRGKVWRAQISIKGQPPKSGTFKTKQEAQDWAHETEKELRSLAGGVSLTHTVKDAFDRYAREVSPGKRGARWELLRLDALAKDTLANVKLFDLRPSDIAGWRDRRLKSVSGSTVNREMNLISNVFNIAVKEWHWLKESPTKDVRRPREAPPRDRIIAPGEIETLCLVLGFDGTHIETIGARVGAVFLFCIETAMRSGEACSLGPSAVRGRVAHLEMTKNGFPRDVPLSKKALELWALTGGQGFGLTSRQVDANFRKARAKTGIDDVVFHDTRHTAITRLAKKMDVLALARMTGHKDIKQLMTYYNESAEEMANYLD